jgi:Raf kinase inhibitor-like YbhB/YbcL family protein
MKLTSPAFEHGQMLPDHCAKEEGNVSPPLHFSDVPARAHSVALIMDDPDAPSGLFTHWLVWNLDRNVGVLTEGHLPGSAREGRNGFGDVGYGGPRPPSGTHRYFFHACALDCRLDLPPGASRSELDAALKNHVIETAELMGRYSALHVSPR